MSSNVWCKWCQKMENGQPKQLSKTWPPNLLSKIRKPLIRSLFLGSLLSCLNWLPSCMLQSSAPAYVDGPPTFIVLNSDYQTSSVALLTASGEVVTSECWSSESSSSLHSNVNLSGDVVLPSTPHPEHQIVVIDRENGLLNYLTYEPQKHACSLLKQIDVKTGFNSNPHDVYTFNKTQAYVTRYNAAPVLDNSRYPYRGDDLLIFNPQTQEILGRIDFQSLLHKAGDPKDLLAHPDKIVSLKERLFVNLHTITADFKTYGDGRIAIINPYNNRLIGSIDLSPLKNCSTMQVIEPDTLWISCQGVVEKGNSTASNSGMRSIKVLEVYPQLFIISSGWDEIDRQLLKENLLSNNAFAISHKLNLILAVLNGHEDSLVRLWTTNTSCQEIIYKNAQGYTLNSLLIAEEQKRFFLTSADPENPRIHIFNAEYPDNIYLEKSQEPDLIYHLPPKQIAIY